MSYHAALQSAEVSAHMQKRGDLATRTEKGRKMVSPCRINTKPYKSFHRASEGADRGLNVFEEAASPRGSKIPVERCMTHI